MGAPLARCNSVIVYWSNGGAIGSREQGSFEERRFPDIGAALPPGASVGL